MSDFEAARTAMVDCQVRPADVTRYAIIEALLDIPRERFVPKSLRDVAYGECEIALAPGRAMMTPRTFAKMLEAASIGPNDLVLEIASGTGYGTAVIARLAEAVVAIEPEEALRSASMTTLEALGVDNAVVSDGNLAAGDPAHGPYDVIFVNGAVEADPDALVGQLKDGGRLVLIRVRDGLAQCRVMIRAGEAVSDRYVFDATAPVLDAFRQAPVFEF